MIHDVLQQNNSKAVYIAVVLEMTGFYVPEQMCEGDEKWYLLQL